MPKIRREKLVAVPITFEDGLVINVVIDKNRTTQAWLNTLSDEPSDKAACDWLAEVIVSWDIQGDDGLELPVSGGSIFENFDQEDVFVFMQDIRAAFVPSRAEKNESSQPSSEKPSDQDSAPLSNSQNGSETSELQPVSASPSTK